MVLIWFYGTVRGNHQRYLDLFDYFATFYESISQSKKFQSKNTGLCREKEKKVSTSSLSVPII
jgi:hypothetical protein